ncbi:hypothetical protein LXL04_029323 [Taraxacum kok-saghyz]
MYTNVRFNVKFFDTMIRLLKIKEIENPSNDNGKSQFTTKTPGELRLHKGVVITASTCIIPKTPKCVICFILFHRNNLISLFIAREAYLLLSNVYPHKSPKVKYVTKVCHPYINFEGNVFLNILRNNWKPVFTITNVVDGNYHLFTATFTSSNRCLSNEH